MRKDNSGIDASHSEASGLIIRLCIIAFSALLLSSCLYSTTTQLLNATEPNEYIRMPEANVSKRVLQDKHLKYYKDDKAQVYYVEKSSLRKLGDYSIRMFAVPVTVIIDAAPAIIVVGAIVGGILSKTPSGSPNFGSWEDQESKEKQQNQIELQRVLNNIKDDDLPIPGANNSQNH